MRTHPLLLLRRTSPQPFDSTRNPTHSTSEPSLRVQRSSVLERFPVLSPDPIIVYSTVLFRILVRVDRSHPFAANLVRVNEDVCFL